MLHYKDIAQIAYLLTSEGGEAKLNLGCGFSGDNHLVFRDPVSLAWKYPVQLGWLAKWTSQTHQPASPTLSRHYYVEYHRNPPDFAFPSLSTHCHAGYFFHGFHGLNSGPYTYIEALHWWSLPSAPFTSFLLFVCSWWCYGFDVSETESCYIIQADLLCLSLPRVWTIGMCGSSPAHHSPLNGCLVIHFSVRFNIRHGGKAYLFRLTDS